MGDLFILIFAAMMTIVVGLGYYQSLHSGVLTIKGRTSRRDHEPIAYWLGMLMGTFAFLVLASGTALMVFFVCIDLYHLYWH